MYRLLTRLKERLDLTQAGFADALGLNQAQVSRIERGQAGGSFRGLCDALRQWVKKPSPDGDPKESNARKWLDLLASGESSDLFSEYLDLFFITDGLDVPFSELWVVAELPAEIRRATLRKRIADRVRSDSSTRVVYWVPRSSDRQMRALALAFQSDEKLTKEHLTSQLACVYVLQRLTLLPIAIFDPCTNAPIGVLSPSIDTAQGVRVVVLPHATTERLLKQLEPRYREVEHDGSSTDSDGTWEKQSLWSLIEAPRHNEAPPGVAPVRKGKR